MSESTNSVATAAWARRYIETFGLALVSIEPGEKAPKGMGWNKPGGYFTSADTAEAFWQAHPNHNLGVVLGPSRVCSLDVDDVQWTRHVLYELLGLDLDAMALVFPPVVGNPARFRILFQVPEGIELNRHSLAWPNENDPDGTIYKALMAKARAAKAAGDVEGRRLPSSNRSNTSALPCWNSARDWCRTFCRHLSTLVPESPTSGARRLAQRKDCQYCPLICWRSGKTGTFSSAMPRQLARGRQSPSAHQRK